MPLSSISWRKLAVNLGLAIASVVATFVVLEIALRIAMPEQPPGTTWGKAVARNSDGFRDREFQKPKPAGTQRVVVLGDSFTWGVGLDPEEALSKLLESDLERPPGRGRIEVVSAAIPGHNTVEESILLEEKGLSYEPDVVLVVYNLNDIEYLPLLDPDRASSDVAVEVVELDPGEDVTRFSRNRGFRGFVLALERRSAFVQFLVPRVGRVLRQAGLIDSPEFSWVEKIYQGFSDENPGWRESKRGLAEIVRLSGSAGADVVVAIYPLFANLESYEGHSAHREVAAYCRFLGVDVVDLLPFFAGTKTQSHWINFMDSHPNAAAHAIGCQSGSASLAPPAE